MASRVVTVFGGSGFLGRHVVRCLAKDGWRIRVAVRTPALAEFLRPAGVVGQIQPFRADVTDLASVRAATIGADAVVNLSGTMHGGFGGRNFTAIHQGGAQNIGTAAAEAGVRQVVHVSALGADAGSPSSYARSKAAGEAAIRETFPSSTILCPSVLFGPEDRFFNTLANMARYTLAMPLFGGGHTRFQPAYVGDVAMAIRNALDATKDDGATFHLGGPETLTFRQIVEMVLRITMRRRLLIPVPFWAASAMAYPMALVPGAPITPDQVRLLRADNVADEGAENFAALGIVPVSPEAMLPGYLWRFRRTGQFEAAAS